MEKLMVGVSGIRGVVGEGLTPESILKYVKAYGKFIGNGTIILGRDSRRTGRMYEDMVASILNACGFNVVKIGIAATPTVLLEVLRQKAEGGIIVTASHNPAQWNALKLATGKGMFLTADESGKMLAESGDESLYRTWDKTGDITESKGASERHVKDIMKLVDAEMIRKRRFRVVLDCVNGAGGVITPLLLDQLGCDYKVINGEPSGLFPRNPEPVPENLKELEKVTAAFGADVGFAHDPDVDRLAIVSEKGRAIGEEYTLALAVMNAAEKGNGTVVTNMSTSSLTEYAAEKNNCSMIRTAVGEVNVAEKMMDQGALIGGEGNGGVIDPRLHLTRDAPMAVALVLEYLARHDISVEEAVSMFPVFSMIKEKQSFEDLETRRKAMEKISKEIISSGVSYDDTDGIRYEFQDGWVHVRQSGTEPVIRYIGEGRSEKAVREEILRLRKLV